MNKTFKDYLGEGPDNPDWMKMGDPSGMSGAERKDAASLESDKPIPHEILAKSQQQADRLRKSATNMRKGYEQGPAINDVKVVLERLQKLADEFDGLADQVAGGDGMDPGEIAREMDGIRERVSAMARTLNKAWRHLAMGDNKPYHE